LPNSTIPGNSESRSERRLAAAGKAKFLRRQKLGFCHLERHRSSGRPKTGTSPGSSSKASRKEICQFFARLWSQARP